MNDSYVYDKAKYHAESIAQHGLPDAHASNHTVVFLRWLIEEELMSDSFHAEGAAIVENYRAGDASIHDVYARWDCCLVSDMLSDEGNAFARNYFDFDRGDYIRDYIGALGAQGKTEFHVPYTESNYRAMKRLIDRRYRRWKRPRRWWPF